MKKKDVESGKVNRAKRKKIVSLAEYEAEAKADTAARKKGVAKTVKAVEKGNLAKGVTVPTGAKRAKKATTKATTPKQRDTGQRGANGAKRTSGLDAAAQVLAKAKEPLNCKEMVQRMLAEGLWRTGGKTPAATIYSAILREIATKGADSRFHKAERGKFALSAKR